MDDDLRVHGGLEDGTVGLQFRLEQLGVDQVAVVGHGDGAAGIVHHDRLNILFHRGPGS